MAHSYIDFCDNHVLLRDGDIFVVMFPVAKATESSSFSNGIVHIVDWWNSDGVNSGSGCIDIPFDKLLNEESSCELSSLLLKIGESFKSDPDLATGESLNSLVGGSRFKFLDQDHMRVASVFEEIAGLLVASSNATKGTAD